MRITRRFTTKAIAVSLISMAVPYSSSAQEFPSDTITLIVHTSAGGPLDTLARKTAEILEQEVGWSTRVENRQGSSGAVAMSRLMLQPADGHTILGVTKSLPNNFALGRLDAEVDNIQFLSTVQGEPSAIAVRNESPLESISDYVSALKAEPDSLTVGGSGRGGNDFVHFLLNEEAGLESTWIPFESAPEVSAALSGGHIDVAFVTPSSVLPQLQSGDVRLLAVSSDERLPSYPDVPTFAEGGFDVEEMLWRGFVTKADTPPEVITQIQDALVAVQDTEEWQEMMQAQNQERFVVSGDEFKGMVEREIQNLARYYEEAGLVAE